MSIFLILLMQAKSEVIIGLLSVLLVAAIIGYVTARFYYKSVYLRRDKGIESSEDNLKTCIGSHNAEKSNLPESLRAKYNEIEKIIKKINYLKPSHTEAGKDDLKLIMGIDPFIEKKLHTLDIYSYRQLSMLTPADMEIIAGVLEINPERISRHNWISQAREFAKNQQQMEIIKRFRILYMIHTTHKSQVSRLVLVPGNQNKLMI